MIYRLDRIYPSTMVPTYGAGWITWIFWLLPFQKKGRRAPSAISYALHGVKIQLRRKKDYMLWFGHWRVAINQLPAEGRIMVSPFPPRPPRLSGSQWRAGGKGEKHQHDPACPVAPEDGTGVNPV